MTKIFYKIKSVIGVNINIKGKTFFLMIACISLGVWMSKFMFKQYDTKAVSKFNTIYLLEIGNYNSNKEMEKALTNVDTYLMEKENDKYFAYIAVTGLEKNYDKLKDYYVKKGFKVEKREKILKSDKFIDTLNKYDLLLEKATEDTTIDKLEKELIQKYKDACDG